jgi:hypothetical protein
MQPDEPDLVALALDPEVHHALAAVQVAHPQAKKAPRGACRG